jgi:hypothetical protein
LRWALGRDGQGVWLQRAVICRWKGVLFVFQVGLLFEQAVDCLCLIRKIKLGMERAEAKGTPFHPPVSYQIISCVCAPSLHGGGRSRPR